VKSEKLMTDQVVACGERRGDFRFPVKVLEHFGCSPVAAAQRWCRHTFLVNLEKFYQYASSQVC
jgi:hypothetical protein